MDFNFNFFRFLPNIKLPGNFVEWFLYASLAVLLLFFLVKTISLNGQKKWGKRKNHDMPANKNKQSGFSSGNRFLLVEIVVFLFLIVVFSSYIASRSMLENKMSTAASIVGESLPYFFENGQALIDGIAEEIVDTTDPGGTPEIIKQKMLEVPFFTRVVLLDKSKNIIGGYPANELQTDQLTQSEAAGVELAKQGVPTQILTIPPGEEGGPSRVSFMTSLSTNEGSYGGVLLGRTDLISNPFFKPAMQAIQSIEQSGSVGIILDEEKRIVYHPDATLLMEEFLAILPAEKQFFRGDSPDGELSYLYYYPVTGKAWSILVSVPFSSVMKSALLYSLPVMGSILFFSLILLIIFKGSLQNLATRTIKSAGESTLSSNVNHGDSGKIFQIELLRDETGAKGNIPLDSNNKAEVLTTLTEILREIVINPDSRKGINKILDSALDSKKSLAKILILEETPSNQSGLHTYSSGENRKDFNYLDKPLLAIMKEQDQLIIQDYKQHQVIDVPEGKRIPGALCAFAIREVNKYSGVFYVVYNDPESISDGETSYLQALANLAIVAIQKGKIGAGGDLNLEKLVSMLDSTPEPVLLIDDRLRLIYSNPAASYLPSLLKEDSPGKYINEVIQNQKLLDMFGRPIDGVKLQDEISLKNGSIYWVNIIPVPFKDGSTGRMAVLRDESHYKEMDTLKTEYVSIVSHDLRSPLSLMKGYASMLPMVGELNDQQKLYTQKIVSITNHLTSLVSDLLDIGRIEGGVGMRVEKFQAHEIVKSVLNLLHPQINQKKIIFGMDMPDSSETVIEADPSLIQQALFNLLENAIKYTQVNGKIQLRIRIIKPNIIFEIVDTGIGIAPLDLPHIFEKFYKVSGKNGQQYAGTGLGLAIVKSIAQRHHGRVWAVSQLGKGSVFYLEIPLSEKRNSIQN